MLKKRTFLNRVLFGINLIFSLGLVLVIIQYYFPFRIFDSLEFVSFFTLTFLLAHLVFFCIWMLRKEILTALFSLLTLLVCTFSFGPFYKFPAENSKENNDNDLTVMSYNVRLFNKYNWIDSPAVGDEIISFIEARSPDVLSIQEHNREWHKKLNQYPHRAESPPDAERSVQAIFSKYPIVSHGSLNPEGTSNNTIYADILLKGDTIRVYNVHLQSFAVVPEVNSLQQEKSGRLLKRISRGIQKQKEQAELLVSHLEQTKHHVLITGDFNNTQFSSIYNIIKGDFQDTFYKEGSGFGRSYSLFNFPMRIDYVLADDSFEVLSHQNFDVELSDHYPIMTKLARKP